ncbi:MAG: phosphotriesterase [Lachnospiraceae bacterium]|jgi:phosphotriesterase-related protein|nr:phosphotriesterase [Lachnospiraceae bacterium]
MAAKKIMTVTGPISENQLGLTSMHEHVTFQGAVLAHRLREGIPKSQLDLLPIEADEKVSLQNVGLLIKNSIMAWDALIQDDEDAMVGECEDFKDIGWDSILEVSVPGIQLDTAMIKRISERSKVNIIVSTGFYTWDSWPLEFRDKDIDFYYRHMMNEIENGVQNSDCKPGCLKIALNDLNQMEENALRAAGQVSRDTNLALNIHPCYKSGGDRFKVLKILKEEGMDLDRLVLSHTSLEERPSSFRDLMYHPELYKVNTTTARRLMDLGITCCYEMCGPLGFEMMGRARMGDFGYIAGLYELIEAGYANRMVLGNDVCGRTMLRRGGALGYTRLTHVVVPALIEYGGVSENAIYQMAVENPKRILAY